MHPTHPSSLLRRRLLRNAAVAAAGTGAAFLSLQARSAGRKITFAWSQAGFCLSPVPVALERGIFERNGLDVELLNWAGSADQLLEALATGKADAGVGLVHRWVKPLEAGFDVKLVGSVHGGCLRLVAAKDAGITTDVNSFKGKTIGVSDLNSPAKQFYSIHLAKKGIDIEKDVQWRVYPADLLDVAVKKGEVQAIADGDPNLYLIEKRNPGLFTELGNSAKGEYAERLCCVIGARGQLARSDRPVAASIARALAQASDYVAENPNEAARVYSQYAPKVPVEDLQNLLAGLAYKHHPGGRALQAEVEHFARDFQGAGILKKSTDPARFASHVTLDVLA
ncbi:MAG: ABC transporter substrate-binding protein [Xenophilus sp.]